jgi:hypothetical protein
VGVYNFSRTLFDLHKHRRFLTPDTPKTTQITTTKV